MMMMVTISSEQLNMIIIYLKEYLWKGDLNSVDEAEIVKLIVELEEIEGKQQDI